MKKSIVSAALVTILFFNCQKNEFNKETHDAVSADSYDEAKDLSGLILPESDDFNSIPQDPKNPLNTAKVTLGQLLFFETRLGTTNLSPEGLHTYSCATCHNPESGFQSSMSQAIGEGGIGFGATGETRIPNPLYDIGLVDVQPIRTPSVLNTAYQEVMMWSGQFGATGVNANTQDSWTAGTPNYNNFLGFMGLETTGIAAQKKHRLIADTEWLASVPAYKELFYEAFPEIQDTERISGINVSLALAAFQRTLLPNQAPFQKYLKGDVKALNKNQKAGLQLFFGKAKCGTCHSGPGLSSMAFYGLGMSDLQNGVGGAFNISGPEPEHKGRGGFTNKSTDLYKFKVPQLYNLRDAKFLGHGSSFTSVTAVVNYINTAVSQNANVPASQISNKFQPLLLTEIEVKNLVNFIENALYDPNLIRYMPLSVPSGNCMPNNDEQSRIDRGCN